MEMSTQPPTPLYRFPQVIANDTIDLLKSHLAWKAYPDNPLTTATLTLALLIALALHYSPPTTHPQNTYFHPTQEIYLPIMFSVYFLQCLFTLPQHQC